MIVLYIAACAGFLSIIMAVVNAAYIIAIILGDKLYLKLLIACIVGNISIIAYLILPFFGFAQVDDPFEYMLFVAGSSVTQMLGIPIGVVLAITWKYFSGWLIRLTNR